MVELLVVVALIGILSTLAVMRYHRFTAINNLEQAANDLKSDLEWAKMRTEKSRIKHYLVFTAPGSDTGWKVYMENSGNSAFDVSSDSLLRATKLPVKVTFTKPTWASATSGPSDASNTTWPSNGLGDGTGGSCSSVAAATYTWNSEIGVCPDVIAMLERGAAYLATTDESVSEAYAIIYNDAKSLNPLLWKYQGSTWSKL